MRILIINQYFSPDRAATGILLGQLAEDLAKENDVTVVCGIPTYAPEGEYNSKAERLRVIRIPLIAKSRANPFVRLTNYVLFIAGARIRTLLLRRHDVVLCWTDPPVVGMCGVGSKFIQRSKFVFVSQDVYPEVATLMKRADSFVSRLILGFTSNVILRFADAVVAVGKEMKGRLIQKGCKEEKIHLISNWHDFEALQPTDGKRFRQKHDIPEDAFVVMHAGNIGFSQDFDTLLAAAAQTIDDPATLYLIVGDGGRQKEIEQMVAEYRFTNVRMLPYQPSDQLAETLSAADLHYVSLLPELTGYIVPSKIYGILSVARPVLANVDGETEVAQIVKEARAGIVATPNPGSLARRICEMRDDRERGRIMGLRGRAWIEQFGGRSRATSAYAELLRKVTEK